jgi:hypothetical protein
MTREEQLPIVVPLEDLPMMLEVVAFLDDYGTVKDEEDSKAYDGVLVMVNGHGRCDHHFVESDDGTEETMK